MRAGQISRRTMSDIETKVAKLIQDNRRLERLLALEKQRRGLAANRLVFVGMHNVAQHWWCTQQAVLKSRVEEPRFFGSYLHDRLVYAYRLGLIDKLPRRDEAMLDVGREITLADVEKLHSQTRQQADGVEVYNSGVETVDKEGKRVLFINPAQPEALQQSFEREAEARNFRIGDVEERPLVRGDFFHASRAAQHPTVRWNFPWAEYTIVGVPDGLTEDFVYEYKSTRERYFLVFVRPVAIAQADLYGYFFQRQKKRVQIEIIEESKTDTYEQPVNPARAKETLDAFARVDSGQPAHPPKPWKCRNCDFRVTCPISQAKE